MSQPHTTTEITPAEWRWANSWAAAILVLSVVPYLAAMFLTPEGWQFEGILSNPLDGHSYMAKMRQGFDGAWLFQFTFTAEPHESTLLFFFYIMLGHLARLTGLPLIVVFHLVRVLAGYALLITLYRFISHITADLAERKLAYILLLTASGLGWLGLMVGLFPIDLWVPEAFIPYSIYANPHFPLGMALMLLLIQSCVWVHTEKRIPWVRMALISVALALILPFALVISWMVIGLFGLWWYFAKPSLPSIQIWLTLWSILMGAPILEYYYRITQTHPIAIGWNAQNITAAPTVPNLLLGYGLLGLLAILGGWLVAQKRDMGDWLLLLWAMGTLVLMYLPLDLQRRLITGLHIPLGILAAIGLSRGLRSLKLRTRRLITNVVIIVGALGTLLVWSLPVLGLMLQPPTDSDNTVALLLLRDEEQAALNWLRENSTTNDVVLASPRMGMFLPGETGARSYYGHPFETIEAEAKQADVEAFYRGEGDVPPNIDYIFVGPSERSLGTPTIPDSYTIVYEMEDITIYEAR